MKKYKFLAILVLGTVLLFGCSEKEKDIMTQPEPVFYEQPSIEKKYTEEDAISKFKSRKDYSNYEISDIVLVDDDEMPLLKAVIAFYDKDANNSSNLAFIYDESIQKICFAANEEEGVKTYELADHSRLTYVGDGAVTTTMRKINTNEELHYKIIFSYEQSTATTEFKVIADPK